MKDRGYLCVCVTDRGRSSQNVIVLKQNIRPPVYRRDSAPTKKLWFQDNSVTALFIVGKWCWHWMIFPSFLKFVETLKKQGNKSDLHRVLLKSSRFDCWTQNSFFSHNNVWKYFFIFFYWMGRDSKDGIRLLVYAWAESNPWFSINLEQEAAESVDWLHTAGLLSEVVCFGHKVQECVWAFCHKNNRGSSRLRSPAESQIDSESNKHTRQHCDLESWICWITFPDWTAVILELLHFTRTSHLSFTTLCLWTDVSWILSLLSFDVFLV